METTPEPGQLLLVDDDETILRGLGSWFERRGHGVRTATTPEDALEMLAVELPDVVVVDHGFGPLSEVTGVELLEQVRQRWPEVGRVLLTGAEERWVLQQAVNVGHAHRILLKPLSGAQALPLVEDTLRIVRLARENERLHEENQRQLDLLARARDELEERVAQRTLELSCAQQEWERTFDAIDDPLAIIDEGFALRRGNQAMNRRGSPPEDCRALTCHQLAFGLESPCEGCPVAESVAERSPQQGEIHDTRSQQFFQVYAYPTLSAETGELLSIVCWHKDVTEQRRLYRTLLQTEKLAALGTLAGGMAHEINNPLAGILTWTQLLRTETEPGSELDENLAEIEHNALRCKEIIKNLRYFAQAGGPNVRRELQLNEVVSKTLRLFRGPNEKRGIRFEAELAGDLRPIVANLNEMQSVVSNLLTNAIAAVKERRGQVWVTTRNEGEDAVLLEVRDDGTGIEPSVLPRIFEPFFSTRRQGEGTGLGLALSYGIVESHGGRIDVQSEHGAGSAFRVLLPAAPEEGEKDGGELEPRGWAGSVPGERS